MNMYSLGMMDLDLSISPDVFGLGAFDATKQQSRRMCSALGLLMLRNRLRECCPDPLRVN